jgi:hypothetical protein
MLRYWLQIMVGQLVGTTEALAASSVGNTIFNLVKINTTTIFCITSPLHLCHCCVPKYALLSILITFQHMSHDQPATLTSIIQYHSNTTQIRNKP